MIHSDAIWHERKRNALGLPWTFTIYELSAEKLYLRRGLFNQRDDEVRLYRITDLSLTRSLWQRLIGTGTIHIDSADKMMKNFDLVNIRNSMNIKEQLSNLVEESRRKNRVYARESMDSHGPDLDGDGIPDDHEFGPDPEDLEMNH